jgi:hypothetical protein
LAELKQGIEDALRNGKIPTRPVGFIEANKAACIRPVTPLAAAKKRFFVLHSPIVKRATWQIFDLSCCYKYHRSTPN